jgi:hypothetical protein
MRWKPMKSAEKAIARWRRHVHPDDRTHDVAETPIDTAQHSRRNRAARNPLTAAGIDPSQRTHIDTSADSCWSRCFLTAHPGYLRSI